MLLQAVWAHFVMIDVLMTFSATLWSMRRYHLQSFSVRARCVTVFLLCYTC